MTIEDIQESVKRAWSETGHPKDIQLLTHDGHGVRLFTDGKDRSTLSGWLVQYIYGKDKKVAARRAVGFKLRVEKPAPPDIEMLDTKLTHAFIHLVGRFEDDATFYPEGGDLPQARCVIRIPEWEQGPVRYASN